ncbi:MAG: hypothetical protein AAF307_08335 [Pseudomonadota bacterium]
MTAQADLPLRQISVIGLLAFLANQALHMLVVLWHGDAPYFLCQFDCNWYARIVEEGYMAEPSAHPKRDAANWAFFPLFPLLSGGVNAVLDVGAHTSTILASKLLLLPALWAYLAFQSRAAPEVPLWMGAWLVALNPAGLYANTGYTETLFLCLTSLGFLAIRADRPLSVGALGALLTATRAVGVGIGLSFTVYALRRVMTDPRANGAKLIFAGLIIPLGLAAYMIFLHQHVGDALGFSHIQRAWGREIGNPFAVLARGIEGDTYQKWMAGFAIFALLMATFLAVRRELGLAVFLVFVTLLPLSTGLDSMGRYVMLQAPVLLGLGLLISRYRVLLPLLALMALGYVLLTYAWLEGRFYVI